jgi:tRNA (guanine-N7-)-methyltransferase
MGETQVRREIVLEGPLLLVPEGRLDWERVFGRRAPVLLDIGAARARYFLNIGPHLPEVDLVGVEVAKKRVESALAKLEEAGLGARARMVWGDALRLLRDHVAPGSLAAVTVLFPDPWPKKRHEKRRIFAQPATAALIARGLAPGGLLLVKTDARAYFGPMRDAFGACADLERADDLTARVAGLPAFSLDRPEETKYETKWKAEGRAIFAAAYRRRATS